MEAEKILVVDDNKEIVYSISELLKYEGYETLKAYDGMEALDIMERENVDLILLDVMMPRLNGADRQSESAFTQIPRMERWRNGKKERSGSDREWRSGTG